MTTRRDFRRLTVVGSLKLGRILAEGWSKLVLEGD